MSLRPIIAEKEGDYCSLGTLIRTSCLLAKYNKRKTVSQGDIEVALKIHMTGDKLNHAINFGGQHKYFHKTSGERDAMLKKLFTRFSIKNIESLYVDSYLTSIYDNIFDENNICELEPLSFNANVDVKTFFNCINRILFSTGKFKVMAKHYDLAKEVLCPDETLNLEWTIEKNVENIQEYFENKATKPFLAKIIYKKNLHHPQKELNTFLEFFWVLYIKH